MGVAGWSRDLGRPWPALIHGRGPGRSLPVALTVCVGRPHSPREASEAKGRGAGSLPGPRFGVSFQPCIFMGFLNTIFSCLPYVKFCMNR